jgi:hypothetical protein
MVRTLLQQMVVVQELQVVLIQEHGEQQTDLKQDQEILQYIIV